MPPKRKKKGKKRVGRPKKAKGRPSKANVQKAGRKAKPKKKRKAKARKEVDLFNRVVNLGLPLLSSAGPGLANRFFGIDEQLATGLFVGAQELLRVTNS